MAKKFSIREFILENRQPRFEQANLNEEFIESGDFIPKIDQVVDEFKQWWDGSAMYDAEEFGYESQERMGLAAIEELTRYFEQELNKIIQIPNSNE